VTTRPLKIEIKGQYGWDTTWKVTNRVNDSNGGDCRSRIFEACGRDAGGGTKPGGEDQACPVDSPHSTLPYTSANTRSHWIEAR
jgi:hypothetical protein